ncbi:MAG: hypothetical protein AMXMBFR59_42260 [Rhodanobacteraceae bacterium]|nr:hypothetical protein [Gammaproteobacteria bacterium]MCZ2078538.1 hypothetical protein [Bryobacterales bacterium]GIK33936.1 MAG: hypothetical protein BroJett010_04950 [Gammaproteobacteria bacterium]
MASFTIRVELHDANWQHYIDMARDLATKGITDVIAAGNGTHYKLSPAEYNFVGNATADGVLEAVKTSAAKTGKRYAVMVTESTRRTWVGLETIQARRSA